VAAQTGQLTNLPDLLGLRVPLGAVFVVFERPKLAEQEKDLGDDNA
tara:strand:+ start:4211 stop:4348 length:138 start_codon:yes stop_codon:yes gene_type:complete